MLPDSVQADLVLFALAVPLPAGVFSPQDAVEFAQQELVGKGNSVKQTCNRLIHEAIRERGCKDNCTVMLVLLRHVPAAGTHS